MRLLTLPFAVIIMTLAGFSFHNIQIFQRLRCGVKHHESPQRSMLHSPYKAPVLLVFVISDRLQVTP